MMFETRTIAPTDTIISLAEAKEQLVISHGDDDSFLLGLVASASRAVEEMTGRALMTQTWRQELHGAAARDDVLLRRTPVQSITSIAYYDRENTLQTAPADDFRLYGDADRSFIRPEVGQSWPALYARLDALRITYVAGYGDSPSDVPAELRTAALMLVAHWYERREAVTEAVSVAETPFGVRDLIGLYRTGWMAG